MPAVVIHSSFHGCGPGGRAAAAVGSGILFLVERPWEGAAGGWPGVGPVTEPSRVHAACVSPRGGGRGDAGAPIGRCFARNSCRGTRGGAAARFQGLPLVPLRPENVAASGEASRAAAVGPAERADRWPLHGLTEGA